MTSDDFLATLSELIQTREKLSLDTALAGLPEWDSLAILSVIAFLRKRFGVSLNAAQAGELKTVRDIVQKAGM